VELSFAGVIANLFDRNPLAAAELNKWRDSRAAELPACWLTAALSRLAAQPLP
jgi:hypothetical protein